MSEWISIAEGPLPRIGSRIVVFTPAHNAELRYRICLSDDLHWLGGATHWAYLTPPREYFSEAA